MTKPAQGGLTLPAWLPRRVTSLMATTLPRWQVGVSVSSSLNVRPVYQEIASWNNKNLDSFRNEQDGFHDGLPLKSCLLSGQLNQCAECNMECNGQRPLTKVANRQTLFCRSQPRHKLNPSVQVTDINLPTDCLQATPKQNALETEMVARAHEYWGG
jgi:hypothetical protein